MLESFFMHPWMLAGLAAAALPVLIEWLFRRRRRTVELPTLRYLLKHKDQKKIKRQDRILLILRTVACVLVALAIARPILRSSAASAGKRHVILVLDATASMNQQAGVASAFGLAKKRAAEMLRALPEGTGATVARLTHEVEVIAEDQKDPRSLAAQVESLRPGEGSAHMSSALAWAKELAGRQDAVSKDVYIFSDFQKYTWLRGTEETRRCAEALRGLATACETVLIDTGGKQEFNYLVSSLAPKDLVLSVGLPVAFEACVDFRGTPPADAKPTLTLLLEGPLDIAAAARKPEKKAVRVLDGPGTANFELRFPAPGEYVVSVELEGDGHRIDNRRSILCLVPELAKVLVLDESLEKDEVERESFYLQHAISPHVKAGFDPVSRFGVKLQPPARAAFENFGEYAAIAVLATSQMTAPLAEKLRQYAEDGGALCFFAGPAVNVYDYNKLLHKDGHGPLPCSWEAAVSPEEAERFELTFAGSTNPAAQALALNFQQTPFKIQGFLPLKVSNGKSQSEYLAQFTDSTRSKCLPAIVERRFGRGRVVQFAFTAGTAWSNLPATTEFVVLMQELLRHLMGSPDAAQNLEVGQPFESSVRLSSQQLLLKGPDGLRARLTPRKDERAEVWSVRFDQTSRAGLYEIDTLAEAMPRRRFVVNLRNEEGDLERLDRDSLAQALACRDFRWQGPDSGLIEAVSRRHSATEFSIFVLVLLTAVLAVESLLAALFGRRRFSASAAPPPKGRPA